MDQDLYFISTVPLPPIVIVDLKPQVHRLRLIFGEHEYLLHCIVDDVTDLANYRRHVSYRSRQLMQELLERDCTSHPDGRGAHWDSRRVQLFDRMIDFEQTALSVQQEIEALKLYVLGRYCPYRYESTLADNSVMLQLITNWEDFMDVHPQVNQL